MMESSDLRNHYDAPAFWLLHGSRFRSIFGQRQMSSGVLVVGKITSQSPAQRSFIPHDDVVQAFPANGTDQPLHKRILPWRSRRGNHFLYPQAFRHFYPVIPVDRIAVAQKISAPLVPGKRFPDLLHRPILAGVCGHLECSTRRRACDNTTKTNRTRKVAVGTTKKSIETICSR